MLFVVFFWKIQIGWLGKNNVEINNLLKYGQKMIATKVNGVNVRGRNIEYPCLAWLGGGHSVLDLGQKQNPNLIWLHLL